MNVVILVPLLLVLPFLVLRLLLLSVVGLFTITIEAVRLLWVAARGDASCQ